MPSRSACASSRSRRSSARSRSASMPARLAVLAIATRASDRSLAARSREPPGAEPLDQRARRHSEHLGRTRLISAARGERRLDAPALDGLQIVTERSRLQMRRWRLFVEQHVLCADAIAGREGQRALDHLTELANISRPCMACKFGERGIVQRRRRTRRSLGRRREERYRERSDFVLSLAKWWNA